MEWLIRTVGIGLIKAITIGEYKRIKAENKRASDYGEFIHLMDEIAAQRSVKCSADETSTDCPMSTVIPQYKQEGRTSDGTAPLRIYTIVGSDGQFINVQGFDLSQSILVTVRHTNGTTDAERIDPSDAMKRIRREAGYLH